MRGIQTGPDVTRDPIEPKREALRVAAVFLAVLLSTLAVAATRTDVTEDPTPVSRTTILIYGGVHDGPDGIDPLGAPRGYIPPFARACSKANGEVALCNTICAPTVAQAGRSMSSVTCSVSTLFLGAGTMVCDCGLGDEQPNPGKFTIGR